MDRFLTELFLYEIAHQCKLAISAYQDLVNSLRNRPVAAPVDNTRIWASIELFVIAAAKISIIFWPQNKKYLKRGEDLRKLLSVDDKVAFKATAPRNHLEHFDERLEEWYLKSRLHNVIDTSILSESTDIRGGLDFLRILLTNRFVFRFADKEYPLNPIIESIVDLLQKVQKQQKQISSV